MSHRDGAAQASRHRLPRVKGQIPSTFCLLHLLGAGAAGGVVPVAAAAETARAAAPHADRSTHLHPDLTHDRPVAEPAVVSDGLAPAGWTGRQPVRPAGQRASQARGE